jgi:hypothetical protein
VRFEEAAGTDSSFRTSDHRLRLRGKKREPTSRSAFEFVQVDISGVLSEPLRTRSRWQTTSDRSARHIPALASPGMLTEFACARRRSSSNSSLSRWKPRGNSPPSAPSSEPGSAIRSSPLSPSARSSNSRATQGRRPCTAASVACTSSSPLRLHPFAAIFLEAHRRFANRPQVRPGIAQQCRKHAPGKDEGRVRTGHRAGQKGKGALLTLSPSRSV